MPAAPMRNDQALAGAPAAEIGDPRDRQSPAHAAERAARDIKPHGEPDGGPVHVLCEIGHRDDCPERRYGTDPLARCNAHEEHGQPAGRDTDTLPATKVRYLPLKTSRGVVGVLGVQPHDETKHLTAEQRRLMEAFANQAALAIESAQLQLSFCAIASPVDGRMGLLLVDEGNMVKNNDTILAVVNQLKPIYVDFLNDMLKYFY